MGSCHRPEPSAVELSVCSANTALPITLGVGCSGQRLVAPGRAARERSQLPWHPKVSAPISDQLCRSVVPSTQVQLGCLPAWITHGGRAGLPPVKKLKARIQQGIVLKTIPGYAAKTDCPFSGSLVSIMPHFPTSAHLAVGQLLRAAEGMGPPRRGYKPAPRVC